MKHTKGCSDGRRGGAGTGGIDTPSSREDSIEKDENTNTTQATSIILNGDGYMSGSGGGGGGGVGTDIAGGVSSDTMAARAENNKHGKYQHHSMCKEGGSGGVTRVPPPRHGKDGGKMSKRNDSVTSVTNDNVHDAKKYKRNKNSTGSVGGGSGGGTNVKPTQHQSDVRINIISDGKTKSSAQRRMHSVDTVIGRPSCLGGGQRKLTLESLDNRSCSNLTSSTYCNGNSSLLDDGDISNFGDGEDSSIVSGMIVQASSNGSSTGLPPYYEKKSNGMSLYSSGGLRTRDMSFDECSSFSRMDSSSTLAREMEIMDLLERERSIHMFAHIRLYATHFIDCPIIIRFYCTNLFLYGLAYTFFVFTNSSKDLQKY